MQREQVESSNIASIGYDPEQQTLEVEFLDGRLYEYYDVPADLHQSFMEASSQGVFFNHSIKGIFRYSEI